MTGRFITLEGGEGVGKSTQARALADALTSRGLTTVVTREPGGSPGGEAIRVLLLEGSDDRWSAEAEALLFAAARADHVARTIRPALASGAWVICDRFIDSSRAYQGGGGGLSDDDILTLHRIGSGGLLPDRTILLYTDAATAATRLTARDGARTDRMGRKSTDYQRRMADCFERFAAAEPDRFRMVDAGQSASQVTDAILLALADLLP